MKKRFLAIVLMCSFILNICSINVFAFTNSEQKNISELINNSIVLSTKTPVCYVWGEQTYVDKENLSVMPIIKNDRTLVPIRFIAENLGADVDWNNETQTATIILKSNVITITINSDVMYVNGQAISLDVPAQNINDRTLIPLRAVSEALNKNIFYHKGFILVSDDDINLDENDSDIQRMVEYLRYTMLVYDRDDSSKISFMNKEAGENSVSAIYADQIPFETDKNKLVAVTGGMYIENLKCTDAGNDNYTVSMDIYNTSYTYGAIEFYDADGDWLGSSKVDKYESIGTSLENTLTNMWEGTFGIGWAIGNGIMGDWSDLEYRNGTISAHSYIEKTVPKGSYLYITNNIKESSYVAMYDMVSIAVDSVSLSSDWINVFNGSDKKKFLGAAKENIMDKLSDEVFETAITNTEFANIIAADYSIGSISDYINDVVEKTLTILSDNNIDIAKSLQEAALEMGKDITVGTAESLLKKAMSFIGTALNICFNIGKTCDFASFIADIRKTMDTDPLLLIVGYEEPSSYKAEYLSILQKYSLAAQNDYYNGNVDFEELGINSELYLSAYKNAPLKYALKDLNNDSIPELFISTYSPKYTEYTTKLSSDYNIYDMYTIYENKAVRLFDIYSMGYRSVYTIREKNVIACLNSGGAFNSSACFYILRNNQYLPQSIYCIRYDRGKYFSGIDYDNLYTQASEYEWDNLDNEYPLDNTVQWYDINDLKLLQ